MVFKCEVKNISDSVCEIVLVGHFDEDSHIPEDIPFDSITDLSINLGRMESINSRGIKTWILFIDELNKYPALNVKLENCPRIFVDQINLVDGMLSEKVKVNSLLIPIFCNKCEESFDVFQEVESLNAEKIEDIDSLIDKVKATPCDSFPGCKREFEIDVVADLYFKFLKK